MTKEEVISRLYDRFIRPTEQKKESYIGVEIEMPIVNLHNKAVDFAVVHQLTAAFLNEFDFTATGFDEEGHVYSAVNSESGDIFSYDCSYNNMEFSFGREKKVVFDYPDETTLHGKSTERVHTLAHITEKLGEKMLHGYSYKEVFTVLERHGFEIEEHETPQMIQLRYFKNRSDMAAFENINFILACKERKCQKGGA